MRTLLFFIFFYLVVEGSFGMLFGQAKESITHLEKLLETKLSPVLRAKTLNKLSNSLNEINITQAEVYANKALTIAQKHNLPLEEAEAHLALGQIHKIRKHFERSYISFQQAYILFDKNKDELGKYQALAEFAFYYSNIDQSRQADSLFQIAQVFFEKKAPRSYQQAFYLNYHGIHLIRKGDFKQSIAYFEKALPIFEASKENIYIARTYNNLGLAYKNLYFVRMGLKYFLKALKIYEEEKVIHRGMLVAMTNIGNMYVHFADTVNSSTAEMYYNRVKKLAYQTQDTIQQIAALEGLARICLQQKKVEQSFALYDTVVRIAQTRDVFMEYIFAKVRQANNYLYSGVQLEKAIVILQDVLETYRTRKTKHGLVYCLGILAKVYSKQKKYKECNQTLHLALQKAKEYQQESQHIQIMQELAHNYLDLEQCQKAYLYADSARIQAQKHALPLIRRDMLKVLAFSDSCRGNYLQALGWYAQYTKIVDSLSRSKQKQDSEELQALYEHDKRIKENEILKKENLLKKHKITQQTLSLVLVSGVLLSMSVIIVILFLFYRVQQKNNIKIKIQNEDLEENNAFKTKLISIIAHDLRRPYANLMGTLQLIKNDDLEVSEQTFLFEEIEKQTKNTQDFINNLLFWVKTQSDNFQAKPIIFDFRIATTSVIELLASQAKEKDIVLEHFIEAGTYLYADMEMIKIITLNLVSNAIKFTPNGGSVAIRASIEEDIVSIHIADTGIGIAIENKKKLDNNKTFYTSGTNGESGFGLGLTICYDFVERNAGGISFESVVGKGTTFTFTIPSKP